MTTEPTAPGPACKFEQGCHRVVACEPGCGAPAAVSVPPPATQAVDRVAVLREAADDLATAFGDPMAKHIGALGAAHLRRRARQIEAGQTTDGQPETPLEKRLRYSERRNDELRAECKRRGKTVLEQSEKIRALERKVDEVRRQLGAEILRAGQAETVLDRVQGTVRRLAAHAVGFQDVLDEGDQEAWGRTVGADIAELRRLAAETQPTSTSETDVAALLALAAVLEVPRPRPALPIQLRRAPGHTDRWAISDGVVGRRWHREHGWVYEAQGVRDEEQRDATRYTLAEAVPLARKLAMRVQP